MRYLSVCSGIEAATMAWHPLGWTPVAFSEIEKFPSLVLAHRYGSNMPGEPLATNGVPNLGDMTKFQEWPDYAIDLLVGGTPCQSFSVAGLRKGLADPRGNLMLTYLAIARRYQPRWLVWENVPGVLSSNGGRDFGTFIRGLEECGYHAAWRVLDAQYVRVDGFPHAVPQRRRRVFVVGYLGDWRRAAAVLFEPEGMRGDSPPRREAGKGTARGFEIGPSGGGFTDLAPTLDCRAKNGPVQNQIGAGVITSTGDIAHCLNAGGMGRQDYETETMVATRDVAATLTRGAESAGKGGYAGRRQEDDDNLVAHSLRGEGFDVSEDGTGRGTPLVPVPYTLAIRGRDGEPDLEYRQDGAMNAILTPNGGRSGIGVGAVAHAIQAGALRANPSSGPDGIGVQEGIAYTLEARSEVQAVQVPWAVRRLTPVECERLQGFPDDYTLIPVRKVSKANQAKALEAIRNGDDCFKIIDGEAWVMAADGPRYKALGNSMAVNCMRWIGLRIEHVERMTAQLAREKAA